MSRYVDAELIEYPNMDSKWDEKRMKIAINAVPTADVRENVHGEWIDDTETDDDGELVYRGIYCSKCQHPIPYVGLKSGTNFCPNCGADMGKMNKLKPCPFCGSEAELEEYNEGFRVICKNIHSCAIKQNQWTLKHKAIEAWNQRVDMRNEVKE